MPVGAFLRGKIDSGIVVALTAGATQGVLRTFSMGFAEEQFSELPFARQVANRFGTQHTEEIVTPDAVSLIDEKQTNSTTTSRLPTRRRFRPSWSRGQRAGASRWRLSRGQRRRGLRRLCDIPGREAAVRALGCRRGSCTCPALGPVASVFGPKAELASPSTLLPKTALSNLALDAAGAYANTLTLCRQPLRRRLMAPDLAASLNGHVPEQLIWESYATAPADDALAGMIAADTGTILPDDFLVKVDRASMAHGLEVRPPLVDHELLELAARIPSHYKIHHGQTKWILKQAAREILPASIIQRRKQGFEIPINEWLRGPLRPMFESTVLDSGARVADLVDQAVARRVYQSHLAGTGRQGNLLWSLLTLARWAERYLDHPANRIN